MFPLGEISDGCLSGSLSDLVVGCVPADYR